MLTCYDFTTARVMQHAGVPMLLVGDSAGNVILGHESTIPVNLDFLIELTGAVRRGAPHCLLMGDMPFGSYSGSLELACANVLKMVKLSGCDCVKLEAAEHHVPLVRELSAIGVPIVAHLGLRPQAVKLMGSYKAQGRTADEADSIVTLAEQMQSAGAAAVLIEAVPAEVSAAVVARLSIPVIGCGAGPACDAFVVVTHDLAGLTERRPRFAPQLGDWSKPMAETFATFVNDVTAGRYPAAEHDYAMSPGEHEKFIQRGSAK